MCLLSIQFLLGMGVEENAGQIIGKMGHACQSSTLCMHTFYDLTHVSPVVFLYLLKECYFYGMVSPPYTIDSDEGDLCSGICDSHVELIPNTCRRDSIRAKAREAAL